MIYLRPSLLTYAVSSGELRKYLSPSEVHSELAGRLNCFCLQCACQWEVLDVWKEDLRYKQALHVAGVSRPMDLKGFLSKNAAEGAEAENPSQRTYNLYSLVGGVGDTLLRLLAPGAAGMLVDR